MSDDAKEKSSEELSEDRLVELKAEACGVVSEGFLFGIVELENSIRVCVAEWERRYVATAAFAEGCYSNNPEVILIMRGIVQRSAGIQKRLLSDTLQSFVRKCSPP